MNTVRFVSKEHYINMKLRIGNRESGTENRKLVPFLVYYTNVSKLQIGNKEPIPGSLLTIIGFILVSGFFYFINM